MKYDGNAITILSWDNPVTIYFRKSTEKLGKSLKMLKFSQGSYS